MVQVPLSYRDPEGEQLELWLTRVHPAGGAPPEAEVWALQGGPGDPATAIVPLFLSLVRDGRLNVTGVMPELRGVGGASRLLCSDGAPADLAVCPEEVRTRPSDCNACASLPDVGEAGQGRHCCDTAWYTCSAECGMLWRRAPRHLLSWLLLPMQHHHDLEPACRWLPTAPT